MRPRVLASLFPAITILVALPAGAAPPPPLECRGHAPEWSLRIDGATATLATLEATGLAQVALEGRLETSGQPISFVYRGRAGGSTADLVAVITREACVDSRVDAREGGGPRDYTARVSLPDGALRQGCCAVGPARGSSAGTAASTSSSGTGAAAPATPAPAAPPAEAPGSSAPGSPAPAPSAALVPGGEVTALILSDGDECKSTGKGAKLSSRGRRLIFDCGLWGGDRLGLVGPLAVDASGTLVAQRVVVEWREVQGPPRDLEPAAARITQISLTDGLTCRHAADGATLAFAGRRTSFTCGMRDGDTVALLGELEPIEGGFRIVRAHIAHRDGGFRLLSSEPILVTTPR